MKSALLPKGRTIYFNEDLHRYTDDMDNEYTSMTTLIKQYSPEFETDKIALACERIGRNPSHPKYKKYKGKKAWEIKKEWEKAAEEGCERGNIKHDYLENIIKRATNYKKSESGGISDRLYTIDDIIRKHDYGLLDLDFFVRTGISERYPKIFAIISAFSENGYKIYSEIGVYDGEYLISGLIDILLVKGDHFIILDWKANKDEIRFESGYFEKDNEGNTTNRFKHTDNYFSFPIDHLPASTGNTYTLQLSGYSYLVETFGYKCKGIILCHIREVDGLEVVSALSMKYLRNEMKRMMDHHKKKRLKKTQKKIMI